MRFKLAHCVVAFTIFGCLFAWVRVVLKERQDLAKLVAMGATLQHSKQGTRIHCPNRQASITALDIALPSDLVSIQLTAVDFRERPNRSWPKNLKSIELDSCSDHTGTRFPPNASVARNNKFIVKKLMRQPRRIGPCKICPRSPIYDPKEMLVAINVLRSMPKSEILKTFRESKIYPAEAFWIHLVFVDQESDSLVPHPKGGLEPGYVMRRKDGDLEPIQIINDIPLSIEAHNSPSLDTIYIGVFDAEYAWTWASERALVRKPLQPHASAAALELTTTIKKLIPVENHGGLRQSIDRQLACIQYPVRANHAAWNSSTLTFDRKKRN